MSFRGASQRWLRRRSAVAIVAGLSLIAAALGCWALRTEIVTGTSAPAVVALSTPDAGQGHLTDGSATASHADFGSTLNDDKAFKSAGLKRDRPTTFSLSTPRSPWTPSSLALAAWTARPGEPCCRAPATVLAGQNLLAQFCVCRC